MKNTGNIWLLVGRETEGNNIKNYILMDYNGCTKFVQKRSIAKFCKEHEVINVQLSGDSITGKGIAITALPRYVKQQGFGLQQVSGVSQAEVIQMAQPLINQYMQKKDDAQQRKNDNSPEAQKAKQNEYVVNKLIVIEDLVVTALAMKDITNELASSEHITRYIKQVDIDNAEGDSLDNLIKRQGVNGLVNGLLIRLDKLNARITKYNLDKNLRNQISKLKSSCNDIKELHERTKKIIKDNKSEDTKHKILLEKQYTEIDNIPVVDDTTDMIAVDFAEDGIPIVDDIGAGAIEVEYSESLEMGSIEEIFKTPEITKEDKELKEKIDNLCEIYSRAVTTMGNIIHNPNRIAEIAHAFDMEYPGIHNRITKDKINSHYNSEDEVIQAVSEHYDYITKEENRRSIWQYLLHNSLGKSGKEVYRITFTRDADIDDTNFNRYQELFDYYIDTLINKIIEQLNVDKEQCIQKALQNFTKISSSKREQILEELFGDSWNKAGSSLEEYGSAGWGGWTAADERKRAKKATLDEYEGLSDEEFMQKVEDVKTKRKINKRAELMLDAFPVEIATTYLGSKGLEIGESYKIPNYDSGKTMHRERKLIAAQLLQGEKSELLNLSDSDFENLMKNLKTQFKNDAIAYITNEINNINNSINTLSAEGIISGQTSEIWKAIKQLEKYEETLRSEYHVYLFSDNPLKKVNLTSDLRSKEKELERACARLKESRRSAGGSLGIDDISDLFDF